MTDVWKDDLTLRCMSKDDLIDYVKELRDEIDKVEEVCGEALDKVAESEAALEFYAEPDNWVSPGREFAIEYIPSPVEDDRGQRAREVVNDRV